jgi:hypothetical protein
MARMSWGASLITGPVAEDATYQRLSVVHAATSFHGQDSARFSYSSVRNSIGVEPRIRDTYASDRRLAGARLGFDLPGGRENEAGYGLLLVQTYGG